MSYFITIPKLPLRYLELEPMEKALMSRAWLIILCFLIALLITSLCVPASATEVVLQDRFPTDNEYYSTPIIVGEVLQLVRDGEGTYRTPPQAKIRVEAVIRGSVKLGEALAIWYAGTTQSDLIDPLNGNYEPKPEWYETPLSAPPVGTRFIAFVYANPNTGCLEIPELQFFRDTPGNRAEAMRAKVRTERAGRIQLIVFLMLLVLPMAGAGISFTPWKLTGLLLSVATLPLYLYYELNIPAAVNIRIDLFLVWPALVLAVINIMRFRNINR